MDSPSRDDAFPETPDREPPNVSHSAEEGRRSVRVVRFSVAGVSEFTGDPAAPKEFTC